jgi:membrane protease YdiL (CAAX protease family)
MFGVAHMDGAEFVLAGYAYRALLGLGADMLWNQLRFFVPGLLAVAAGGLLFTWLLHRWDSLWPAIALHAAINFWWTVSVDRGSVDRWSGSTLTATNVAHALAMTIAIVATLRWTKRGPTPP